MILGSQKFPKKWTLSMTLAEISSALHKQVNKKKKWRNCKHTSALDLELICSLSLIWVAFSLFHNETRENVV